MTATDAAILGALQGLTEFLPVSSSGHLTLGAAALGWNEPHLLFDIVVHVGTLLVVCWVFRADIAACASGGLRLLGALLRRGRHPKGVARVWAEDPGARLAGLVAAATVPTGVIGLGWGHALTEATSSPRAVGTVMIGNGLMLLSTRWLGRRGGGGPGRAPGPARPAGLGTALLVGVGQGLAVLRGLSRSGTTISVGLLAGMDREAAARLSFLMCIPAITGALILEFDATALAAPGGAAVHGIGFVTAAVVGYFALRLLLAIVRRGALHWFAPYSWAVGGAALWIWGDGGPAAAQTAIALLGGG